MYIILTQNQRYVVCRWVIFKAIRPMKCIISIHKDQLAVTVGAWTSLISTFVGIICIGNVTVIG